MWRPRRKAADADPLSEEIARLSAANREGRALETERRLLQLRHEAGLRLLDAGDPGRGYAEPAGELPDAAAGLPEIGASDLGPGLIRSGILRDGCLLVRGLIPATEAETLARRIDEAVQAAERHEPGEPGGDLYDEFTPNRRRGENLGFTRPWVKQGGGVLAVDSPMVCCQVIDLMRSSGLSGVISDYLGEPAVISAHKTTLRKADPSVAGAWHQDGAFMGDVRSVNLWLSLSRCGDEAPGLDLVPRRIDEFLASQTEEAKLANQISQSTAEAAAGEAGILRPVFEPGDALFFDEMFLHKTGSDPSMSKPRFALESWFFAPSAFPAPYDPLAI